MTLTIVRVRQPCKSGLSLPFVSIHGRRTCQGETKMEAFRKGRALLCNESPNNANRVRPYSVKGCSNKASHSQRYEIFRSERTLTAYEESMDGHQRLFPKGHIKQGAA